MTGSLRPIIDAMRQDTSSWTAPAGSDGVPLIAFQPHHTLANIVNNKPQAQSPVTPVYQKSLTNETGMNRININPVEALDKKQPTLTQRAQEAHDGMFTDSINVVHIQQGLDNTDTDNIQTDVPEEQESRRNINNAAGDGKNVLSFRH